MITTPKPLTTASQQAAWLERLRRRTAQLKPTFGSGIRALSSSRGLSYTVAAQAGGAGITLATFKIKANGIRDNDLLCVEWDGATAGETEFIIARPWLSRRYVWDYSGSGYTYVSAQRRTIGADTHEITQPYAEGNMIVAANLPTISDVGEWEWLDLNMDGRDWARIATTT